MSSRLQSHGDFGHFSITQVECSGESQRFKSTSELFVQLDYGTYIAFVDSRRYIPETGEGILVQPGSQVHELGHAALTIFSRPPLDFEQLEVL
jgi:hypothetical protein